MCGKGLENPPNVHMMQKSKSSPQTLTDLHLYYLFVGWLRELNTINFFQWN